MFGIRDYLKACEYRQGFLENQSQWLYQERQQFQLDVENLVSDLDRVRSEMAGYLVPEINDEHLKELEGVLGGYGLMDIKAIYESKFDAAERRRVQLEGMEEVRDFEQQNAQASRLIKEIEPERNELRSEFMHWSGSKWYQQLDRRRYFDADYWPTFFNKFWDWRAVSFLMADLSKGAGLEFEEPDQLKRHYRQLQEKYNEVIPEYQKRVKQRERIQSLKQEHQQCVTAPERLLGELYAEIGAAVLDYLKSMPQAKREEIAALDPNLNTFLKKELGLSKQIQYLSELTVTRVDNHVQQVQLEREKVGRKIDKLKMKLRRRKRKWYSRSDIDRMTTVKADKWEKRRHKIDKIRRKVADFKKYDDGSIQEDFLWWDLITNGSYGDDIYEVRTHRSQFPNWDHRRHRDPWEDDEIVEAQLIDGAADDLVASMADNDADLFDGS